MSVMKPAWSRLSILFLAFICGAVLGCGDDDGDFLVSRGGSLAATGGTGGLLFSFFHAQSAVVPGTSDDLSFEFFPATQGEKAAQEEPIFRSEQKFASSVLVVDVPLEAKSVRITVYDPEGRPLIQLTDEVLVQVGQTTQVDLSDAKVEQILPTGLVIEPKKAQLGLEQALQLKLFTQYSNEELIPLTSTQITRQVVFSVDPVGVVEIDERGRVLATETGSVLITASSASLGTSQAEIQVVEP